jgi:hypothetical protein
MTKRFRLRFTFWLDMLKEGELAVAEAIQKLKVDRLFAETVRDGIRLVCDLRDGKLDVLFELFPWVRAEFLQYMREIALEPPTGQVDKQTISNQHIEAERAWLDAEQVRLEQAWQERRLAEAQQALEAEKQQVQAEKAASQRTIQEQLDRIEQWMLSQGHQVIERPITETNYHPNGVNQAENRPGRPKQLVVPQFTAPPSADDDDDEDLLEFKKDESAAMRTTQNFLRSVSGLTDETKQPPKTNGNYSTGGKRRYKQAKELGQ